MATDGLNAFDEETRKAIELRMRRPFDRFGNPIFCNSCTSRVGRGYSEQCPRWNAATHKSCPFREVMIQAKETEAA